MTGLLIIICVGLLGACIAAAYVAHPSPAASGTEIHAPTRWSVPRRAVCRFGTYNVHSGKGTDGVRDIRRAAEVVRGVDVLALQELQAATHFRTRAQIEQLARILDLGWLFAPTRTRWFRDYRGNGLLSRFPATHWYREPLVDTSGHSFRVLTTVTVDFYGRTLWLLFTHLHPRLAREQQLATVLQRFSQYSPAILMGDLNTARDDPTLARALAQPDIVDAIRSALGDRDPLGRIDWILTKGLTVVSGGLTEVGISDHPYYWVDIEHPG
ncbi:MAG: endonuclease/exonuclease/phosphatase family protein [Gammaproteobacteria bacterium]|nr:endonuclease/exonuclease/phosphatase family protein [Gammaproteobacteria bacterium]